ARGRAQGHGPAGAAAVPDRPRRPRASRRPRDLRPGRDDRRPGTDGSPSRRARPTHGSQTSFPRRRARLPPPPANTCHPPGPPGICAHHRGLDARHRARAQGRFAERAPRPALPRRFFDREFTALTHRWVWTKARSAEKPTMNDAPTMIEVDRLSKAYGKQLAVDQVSFHVNKGEVLGFLGPNGAGKSTTMKILTCYLTPTGGAARVAGYDVFSQSLEVRRRIGYLPEDTPLYRDMVVLEYLEYVTELRGLPKAKRRPRIKEIGETTGILEVLGKKIGELSRGYRQRVGLTQAMVHDPDILILDEPTSGLD